LHVSTEKCESLLECIRRAIDERFRECCRSPDGSEGELLPEGENKDDQEDDSDFTEVETFDDDGGEELELRRKSDELKHRCGHSSNTGRTALTGDLYTEHSRQSGC
jgi:hypothetical protein